VNLEKIQPEVDRIRRVLQARDDGWANEKARREIIEACNSIERSCDSSYIAEKLIDIRISTDNLYSARKHHKFEQGSSSGVKVLRAEIQSLLVRIEDQSNELAQSDIVSDDQTPA
jgi:uncharacterized protein YecE (DUF72 family)